MANAKPVPVPRRRRWRWRFAAAALVLLPLVLAAAFPWALGTPPARRWLLARANRALAPGGLGFSAIRFSWFGPTRITGFVLIDPWGDRVLTASEARWDRNLGQILFDRPRYGTLLLDGAHLDIERGRNGSIDLYETLKPVMRKDPRLDLRIVVRHGLLRFRSAGVPEPVLADETELVLHLAPAPDPITWRLSLTNAAGTPRAEALEAQGRYHRWRVAPDGRHDLEVAVNGDRWPWTLERGGVSAAGVLHGKLVIDRRDGLWAVLGDARVSRFEVAGPRLKGDRLRLDQVKGGCDLAESAGGWSVRRLELESPLGSLRARGTLPASGEGASRIEGALDLAALAGQLPHLLRLRDGLTVERGRALVRVDARAKDGRQTWDAEARLSDIEARDRRHAFTLHDPATVSARFVRAGKTLTFERAGIETPFLKATGRGDLDRGFEWSGTLDLANLQRQLRDLVDLGKVELAGGGDLSGHYRRTGGSFKGTVAANLRDTHLAGVLPGTLRRDALRLDLTVNGAATATGLPSSWNTLTAAVRSGDVQADVSARAGDGETGWTVNAQSPVALGERRRLAKAQVAARWGERAVAIDPLVLSLEPAGDGKGERPRRLSARGAWDRSRNELILKAAGGGREADGLALSEDGLRVTGLGKAIRAEGGLVGDVPGLVRLVAPSAGDWRGTWAAHATAQSGEDGVQIGAKLAVRDLATPDGRNGGPVVASLKALLSPDRDRLELSELALSSPYATLDASGRLTDLSGRRLADLRGTLSPDWEAINSVLAERVEPKAHLEGEARPLRLKGPLAGDWRKDLDGEFGFDLKGANFYGMHVGPAPIVVRAREGAFRFEPIDTTINGGRLHLEPTLALDDEDGASLEFGPESSLRDAAINDEVSHRVLSFVAPVLDQATRVHGSVSVALDEAVFPIGGDAAAQATIDGKVQFQDVEFVPGPLADELFALIGKDRRPSIRLNEPVALAVADRRVRTSGLALPLGDVTRIELSGWVDFDRNIEMTASLPFTPAMVGNVGLLSQIVEGTKVSVPIRGTLGHPQIDKQAMKGGMKDLGKTLLERTAGAGAGALLERLTRPRDPNAPPPPTPEERRARRQERRAERRMRRDGLLPPSP